MTSQTQLPCSDIGRTKRFLAELGFECRVERADMFTVVRDGRELSYWKIASPDEAKSLARETNCSVQVGNLAKLRREFKARSLSFEVEEQPWGATELHILDPDGNLIRFLE